MSLQIPGFVMDNQPFVDHASWFWTCWSRLRVEWRGSLTREAITEAVRLAREVLVVHAEEKAVEVAV